MSKSRLVSVEITALASVVGGFGSVAIPADRPVPGQAWDPAENRRIVGAQMRAKMQAEAHGDASGANTWDKAIRFWNDAGKRVGHPVF